MVGNGINKLFECVLFEGEKIEENVFCVCKEFFLYYDWYNVDESCFYLGILELLEILQDKDYKLVVVFNKYQVVIEKLIVYYFLGIWFVVVFGQCEGVKVKLDFVVVYDILWIVGVLKDEVLYVGDLGVDMQMVINSGVIFCGVMWGFCFCMEFELFCLDYIVDKVEIILFIV